MALEVISIVASLAAIATSILAVRSIRAAIGLSPYVRMLGKVVEYKKYERSDWEVGVVIAVSWHGAVQIRDRCDNTFWMSKFKVPGNVKEVG